MLEGPDACQPSPSLSRFLPRDLQSPELCPSETQMLQRGTPYTRSPGQPPLPSKSGEHPHLEHSSSTLFFFYLPWLVGGCLPELRIPGIYCMLGFPVYPPRHWAPMTRVLGGQRFHLQPQFFPQVHFLFLSIFIRFSAIILTKLTVDLKRELKASSW